MRLIIASNNAHKVREIKQILGRFFDEVLSLAEAGFFIDVEEDGETFMENAQKKAREVMRLTGCAALSDDSGLCVDALNGAPGVYSARYAGEHGGDERNNEKLLVELANVPAPRRASYVCAMVLCFPDGRELSALGQCAGQILTEYMGTSGFGYDPLFMPDGYDTSFGVIPSDEKNRISHRAKALHGLLKQLEEQ